MIGSFFRDNKLLAGVAVATSVAAVLLIVANSAAFAVLFFEAETGTPGGTSSTVTDAKAGKGSAVNFGPSGVSVLTYGAKGDGVTDDQNALTAAFTQAPANSTIVIPAGKTFVHSNTLRVTVPGLHVTGSGTILAKNAEATTLDVQSANVTIDGGLTLKFNTAGQVRHYAGSQSMIFINNTSGTKINGITVDGSPSIGILAYGASFYSIDSVVVKNTLADSIHSTLGSHDATISNSTSINSGDDGFANVSYVGDGAQVYNITYTNDFVQNQAWARGFSVVGGHDITFNNIRSDATNGAAIYISAEREFNTYGVNNVKINGATLVNSNTNSTVDQGAVLVYNSQSSQKISNVNFQNITIISTRSTASRQVGLIIGGSGGADHITFNKFTISGGPSTQFYTDGAGSIYNKTGWIFNNVAQPDHIGWTQ